MFSREFLERYEVLSVLGEGSFGVVYRVQQRQRKVRVFIVVLGPDHCRWR